MSARIERNDLQRDLWMIIRAGEERQLFAHHLVACDPSAHCTFINDRVELQGMFGTVEHGLPLQPQVRLLVEVALCCSDSFSDHRRRIGPRLEQPRYVAEVPLADPAGAPFELVEV